MSKFKDLYIRRRTAFQIIGGTNYFPKAMTNIYAMINYNHLDEGVVKIKGKLYYLLGIHREEAYTRSAGRVATGALIGGILTGGVGAIVGGALGAKEKDVSDYFLDFADYETKQEFTVQVKLQKSAIRSLMKFRVANPINIGLEDLPADK